MNVRRVWLKSTSVVSTAHPAMQTLQREFGTSHRLIIGTKSVLSTTIARNLSTFRAKTDLLIHFPRGSGGDDSRGQQRQANPLPGDHVRNRSASRNRDGKSCKSASCLSCRERDACAQNLSQVRCSKGREARSLAGTQPVDLPAWECRNSAGRFHSRGDSHGTVLPATACTAFRRPTSMAGRGETRRHPY